MVDRVLQDAIIVSKYKLHKGLLHLCVLVKFPRPILVLSTSTIQFEKYGPRTAVTLSRALLVQCDSPLMETLQGFYGRLGMALSMTLPCTRDPFSSILVAVSPETCVTLTLAHSKDAFQLGGPVSNSHLI